MEFMVKAFKIKYGIPVSGPFIIVLEIPEFFISCYIANVFFSVTVSRYTYIIHFY